MEASEYGIEKESRGRLRQTIVESDQDSSRTGFDGRPVRQQSTFLLGGSGREIGRTRGA